VTHLAPGQLARLRWTVLQADPTGEFIEIPGDDSHADRILAKRGGELRVTYQAIAGDKHYMTELSIREVTDEFPEFRISII
jgi:hypothetical protein